MFISFNIGFVHEKKMCWKHAIHKLILFWMASYIIEFVDSREYYFIYLLSYDCDSILVVCIFWNTASKTNVLLRNIKMHFIICYNKSSNRHSLFLVYLILSNSVDFVCCKRKSSIGKYALDLLFISTNYTCVTLIRVLLWTIDLLS